MKLGEDGTYGVARRLQLVGEKVTADAVGFGAESDKHVCAGHDARSAPRAAFSSIEATTVSTFPRLVDLRLLCRPQHGENVAAD